MPVPRAEREDGDPIRARQAFEKGYKLKSNSLKNLNEVGPL